MKIDTKSCLCLKFEFSAKTTPQIPVHPVPPVARQKPEETVEEEVKKPVSENNKTVSPPPSEPNVKNQKI